MTIAIFGNTFRPTILSTLGILFDFFEQRNIALQLEKELFEYLKSSGTIFPGNYHIIENDDFKADLALSIGGDGTFLNTAARIGSKNIPILGINTGRLGFLADISGDEPEKALHAILDNNLSIEERSLLKVETSDGTVIPYPYVLNDVSVLKQDTSSMMSINTWLNGEAVHTYHADGLIIATPTGSTAYSLSAGGPIITPQAENIILSPVASHSLTVRPLVIPDTWTVDLEVITRNGFYQVALDGRTMVLDQNVKIKITRGEYTIKVARQPNHTFFNTLKNKLMWGLDKRN